MHQQCHDQRRRIYSPLQYFSAHFPMLQTDKNQNRILLRRSNQLNYLANGCREWIRTIDLWVMSPVCCHCIYSALWLQGWDLNPRHTAPKAKYLSCTMPFVCHLLAHIYYTSFSQFFQFANCTNFHKLKAGYMYTFHNYALSAAAQIVQRAIEIKHIIIAAISPPRRSAPTGISPFIMAITLARNIAILTPTDI